MKQADQHFTPPSGGAFNPPPSIADGFVNYFQVLDLDSGYALTRELALRILAQVAMDEVLKERFPNCYVSRGGWCFDEGDPGRQEFIDFITSDASVFSKGKIRAMHPEIME